MTHFLETEDGEIEKATCVEGIAKADYVRVIDTSKGINIYVNEVLRTTLNYAELSRLEACLKMLDASKDSPSLLGYFDVYEANRI